MEIQACLNPEDPDLQGAWNIVKRWYRHATACQPHPAREDLQKVSNDYATLYTAEVPSPQARPFHHVFNLLIFLMPTQQTRRLGMQLSVSRTINLLVHPG
jgi:hypothetical protein